MSARSEQPAANKTFYCPYAAQDQIPAQAPVQTLPAQKSASQGFATILMPYVYSPNYIFDHFYSVYAYFLAFIFLVYFARFRLILCIVRKPFGFN